MKKYILLIYVIFLSLSCKHNEDYTPYTVAIPMEDSIYYYKSCKTNEVEAICKLKCEEGIDISKLRHQNIKDKCREVEVALLDSDMGDLFNQNIIDNIISPIRNYNTLNILSTDYDNFIEFDKLFSKYGNKSGKAFEGCKSKQCKEKYGQILNVWKKYTKNYATIYQNYTFEEIGSIQWVMLMEKNEFNDLSHIFLTYEEAKKACEEYEFANHKDWSLPTSENLVKALELDLGNELFSNFNASFESYRVWTLEQKVYRLMRMSKKIEPIKNINITDAKEYVLCTRNYKLGD